MHDLYTPLKSSSLERFHDDALYKLTFYLLTYLLTYLLYAYKKKKKQ